MSKPVKMELVKDADVAKGPPPGTVRKATDVPILERTLRIEVNVPDRRTRLIDIVPLARSICDRITEIAAAASEAKGKPISCRKGCAACCRVLLVEMSEPEALCLIQDLKRLPASTRNRVLDGFVRLARLAEQSGLPEALGAVGGGEDPSKAFDIYREWWRQARGDCPILLNEACSMYPSRPMACRELLVTSDPALCPSWRENRVEVPVKMYQVLARLSQELDGRRATASLVPLPTLPGWCAGKTDLAERTWRGPRLVSRFLDILCGMAEQAQGHQAKVSVTFT